MSAVYVSNIVINSGTDFNQTFTLQNSTTNTRLVIDGCTIESQMRKHPSSKNYVEFDSEVLDSSAGIIYIGLTTSVTNFLKPGRYVYDIVLIEPLTFFRTRIIEGMALVREGVTK